MDLLERVTEGFRDIDAAPEALKQQAARLPAPVADRAGLRRLPAAARTGSSRQQQWAGLLDRFYQILPFGTGGRRGAVGIGPNRMNLWTLGASVQGHCEYLKERFPGVEPLRVVARLRRAPVRGQAQAVQPRPAQPGAAPVVAATSPSTPPASTPPTASTPTSCRRDSPRYLATPELSFTIRQLQAHGGLNISASHNPPDDNGGKFYDERGGQPVAARRPDHGRPRRSGDDDQAPALGRGRALRPGPLPR